MIAFKDIVYRAGKITILNGVSCTAGSGELMAIMGPNGSGKSTLLRIAAGDIKATSGDVQVFGKSIEKISPEEAARMRAVLSQHWQAGFPFEVREIIMMGRYPHFGNSPSEEDFYWVDYAAEMAGVTPLLTRKFTQLSGGEQQRVQFARVLAQVSCGEAGKGILLLDEPTSSLDLRFQLEIMNILRQLCAKGFTIITVIHDLSLANRYADHLLFLKKGEKVACGLPAELLSASMLSDVYDIEEEFFTSTNIVTR